MISTTGRVLIYLGVLFIIVGGVFLLSQKVQWIGRLPGDIYIKKEGHFFYFPVTTCIIISAIFSLIFSLLGRR